MKTILYINDEHCTSIEQLKSYFSQLFNPSEHEENRIVEKTIEYNRRTGKGEFGEVSVEVEGEKIEVKIEGSHSKINGHEYVDLGLSSGLKWATCNVGANSREEYGEYFAWGETTTKADYSPSSSRTHRMHTSDLGWLGYIYGDNPTPQYDAATANWGAEWRMPTKKRYVCIIL